MQKSTHLFCYTVGVAVGDDGYLFIRESEILGNLHPLLPES